jgi:hypothetical protein
MKNVEIVKQAIEDDTRLWNLGWNVRDNDFDSNVSNVLIDVEECSLFQLSCLKESINAQGREVMDIDVVFDTLHRKQEMFLRVVFL